MRSFWKVPRKLTRKFQLVIRNSQFQENFDLRHPAQRWRRCGRVGQAVAPPGRCEGVQESIGAVEAKERRKRNSFGIVRWFGRGGRFERPTPCAQGMPVTSYLELLNRTQYLSFQELTAKHAILSDTGKYANLRGCLRVRVYISVCVVSSKNESNAGASQGGATCG